jgi:hypothetical protein
LARPHTHPTRTGGECSTGCRNGCSPARGRACGRQERSGTWAMHAVCLCVLCGCSKSSKGGQGPEQVSRSILFCSQVIHYIIHCCPRLSQYDCCLPFPCIYAQTMQHCQHPHTAINLSNSTWASQQSATLCLWHSRTKTTNAFRHLLVPQNPHITVFCFQAIQSLTDI